MLRLPLARTGAFVRGRGGRAEPSRRRKRFSSASASATPEPSGGGDGEHNGAAAAATVPDVSPVNTSLALSVHFRQPDLGMRDYEILSRGTAFLMRVDPPDSEGGTSSSKPPALSAFPHLQENAAAREELLRKQDYKYDPASGPPRFPQQLNWLEFCPTAFRPRVHVMASSHVISPWLWPQYYGHDWLKAVEQDHVRYSLEVLGGKTTGGSDGGGEGGEEEAMAMGHDGRLGGSYRPLAKFALNPYPIHHPNEMDMAVIHLKDEDSALKHLINLGIQPLHLPTAHEFNTSEDPVFDPGERVLFQGFEVFEANKVDDELLPSLTDAKKKNKSNDAPQDDERMFHPYSSLGTLMYAAPDQFLARTPAGTIPEGICGGPVIQLPKIATARGSDNTDKDSTTPLTVQGIVQGVVPANHEQRNLAGLASFHPSYRIREFVDFAERIMLEHIVEPELFKKIVDLKEKRGGRGGTTTYESNKDGEVHRLDPTRGAEGDNGDDELPNDPGLRASVEGTSEDSDTPNIDRQYSEIVASLRENHTPEEVDAILATIEREQEEVIKIMETQGGDMDDVIAAVRRKTYEEKERIMMELEREMSGRQKASDVEEGEIVSEKDAKKL